MIVQLGRRFRREQRQAPRHAEMQNQRAGVETDENVFGAPLDRAHGLIANIGLETAGDRPAQAPLAHDGAQDPAIEQRRRNAAAGGFYFRKLGHGSALGRALRGRGSAARSNKAA